MAKGDSKSPRLKQRQIMALNNIINRILLHPDQAQNLAKNGKQELANLGMDDDDIEQIATYFRHLAQELEVDINLEAYFVW